MTDWCTNTLTVSGPSEDLTRFRDRVTGGNDAVLDLPGTDARSVHGPETEALVDGTPALCWVFETAWSEANVPLEQLTFEYPTLRLELVFEHSNAYGAIAFRDGATVLEVETDEATYVARPVTEKVLSDLYDQAAAYDQETVSVLTDLVPDRPPLLAGWTSEIVDLGPDGDTSESAYELLTCDVVALCVREVAKDPTRLNAWYDPSHGYVREMPYLVLCHLLEPTAWDQLEVAQRTIRTAAALAFVANTSVDDNVREMAQELTLQVAPQLLRATLESAEVRNVAYATDAGTSPDPVTADQYLAAIRAALIA